MSDDIREQRRRIAQLAGHGRKLGFLLYGVAVVVVAVAAIGSNWGGWATTAIALVIVGSIVLLPGIIFGYATTAAERHDREHGL